MRYDPELLEKFARILYNRANTVVATWTVFGALLGGLLGYLAGGRLDITGGNLDPALGQAAIGAILFGAIGFAIGSARAFRLKLMAQAAMCLRQIEMNTRSQS